MTKAVFISVASFTAWVPNIDGRTGERNEAFRLCFVDYCAWRRQGLEEFWRRVRAEIDDDGKVSQIPAVFYASESSSVYSALFQRFGEPTETVATNMTLNDGASIPGRNDTWVGERAILTFSSQDAREVDHGVTDFGKISFTSIKYIDQKLKEQSIDTLKKSENF